MAPGAITPFTGRKHISREDHWADVDSEKQSATDRLTGNAADELACGFDSSDVLACAEDEAEQTEVKMSANDASLTNAQKRAKKRDRQRANKVHVAPAQPVMTEDIFQRSWDRRVLVKDWAYANGALGLSSLPCKLSGSHDFFQLDHFCILEWRPDGEVLTGCHCHV